MPLYEYECEACGHRVEQIQKFSDPPLERCPKCSGPVHKLMSSPAIQFKGSGWYITDYAKKDSASGGKSDSAPAAKEKTDKTEAKSSGDATPASTSTTSPVKD